MVWYHGMVPWYGTMVPWYHGTEMGRKMGLGRLQATDQPHVPLLAHGVAGGPEDLASSGLVLAARGTGGPDDPMGRRPHGGGKQHLSTGIMVPL